MDGGDEPPGERVSCCPGSHPGAERRERDLDVCILAPPWQGLHTSQEPRETVHRLLLSHPSVLTGVVDTGSPTGPDASSLVLVCSLLTLGAMLDGLSLSFQTTSCGCRSTWISGLPVRR